MKQFDPIKHKNSQPFSTPEGYFEDFTQRMMARIATEEKAKEERVTAEAAQPSAQQTASNKYKIRFIINNIYLYSSLPKSLQPPCIFPSWQSLMKFRKVLWAYSLLAVCW